MRKYDTRREDEIRDGQEVTRRTGCASIKQRKNGRGSDKLDLRKIGKVREVNKDDKLMCTKQKNQNCREKVMKRMILLVRINQRVRKKRTNFFIECTKQSKS